MSRKKSQPTPEVIAAKEKAKLTIKELLERMKDNPVLLLQHENVTMPVSEDEELQVCVWQLTKHHYDLLNRRISKTMPVVPYIEQHYTVARRNPTTGEVKPAGTYKEPNPQDPSYIEETQQWFNEACVWLAIFSAAGDLGIDLTLPEDKLDEQLDDIYQNLSKKFSTPSLLSLAIKAAEVNRGLQLADQLLASLQDKALTEDVAEILQSLRETLKTTPINQ